MTTELSTKRAALELIEAEKQRRIDLKMASGEAIWGPPLILVSRVPDKETLPDGENAAVVVERDDATGREVYREVIRIVTGVPRRERDSDEQVAAALAQPRTNDKMLRSDIALDLGNFSAEKIATQEIEAQQVERCA